MVEEKKDIGGRGGGEKKTNGIGRPSPNPPRLSPCKRIPTAATTTATTTSSSSISSHHLLKKTRYSPDLFLCHSCGLRFPSNNNNNPLDHLHSLRSQWRIALLCRACLARVKSADLCSYCFSPISPADDPDAERSFPCLRCSCRVHLGCVNREHRCVDPRRLDPGCFTCVDCCAIPKYWGRNPGVGSRVSLEEVVREASSMAEKKVEAAARARENALKKAAAAKRAAERARNALDAVLAANGEISDRNALVADEELALQLHLAINGSRRISRSSCSLSSGAGSIDLKKVHQKGGDSIGRDADSGGRKSCKTVEICTEDKFSLDLTTRTGFGQGSDVDSHSNRNEHKKLIDDSGKDGHADMPLKEDQGSCSDKVVSSHGDDHSIDSVSLNCERKKQSDGILLPSTCRRYYVEESEVQEKNSMTTPDRYLKKYSMRRSRLKGMVDEKDCQLVP